MQPWVSTEPILATQPPSLSSLPLFPPSSPPNHQAAILGHGLKDAAAFGWGVRGRLPLLPGAGRRVPGAGFGGKHARSPQQFLAGSRYRLGCVCVAGA